MRGIYTEWYKGIMLQFGYRLPPIVVKQDNTSTMWIVSNGGNWTRTKHLLVRKNKAKESVLNGTIDIQYCATAAMRADLGTKPLSFRSLMVHLNGIKMMEVTRPDGVYTLRNLPVPDVRVKPIDKKETSVEKRVQTSKPTLRKVNTRK